MVEYCIHHKDDPVAPVEEDRDAFDSARKRTDDIDEWDDAFIKVDNEQLFEIILAANYLDIKSLLDLGCNTVANMLKGKTAEQVIY